MYGHSVRCTDDLCLDLLYAAEVELCATLTGFLRWPQWSHNEKK